MVSTVKKRFLLLLALSTIGFATVVSCKHSSDTAEDPGDGAVVCQPTPPGTKPQASCDVTLETPPIQALAARHVPEGSPVTYCTNPPSSGSHYPIWAQFQEYDHPIPTGYLVHSLEHGAVILYWKCDAPDGAACTAPPGVLTALRKVRDDTPTDGICDPSIRVRIIIAPSTTIETPIAAAAWGALYHAQCADVPTLEAFVHDHYGHGTEDLCVPGEVL
jgi:Protein of unknown function (DUF3105)